MDTIKSEIINEVILLMPEFRGREDELKIILEKLIQLKPEAEMNPQFKQKLRDRIIAEAGKGNKVAYFPKKLNLYRIISGGMATAAVLFLAFTLFLRSGTGLNKSEQFASVQSIQNVESTTDYNQEQIPSTSPATVQKSENKSSLSEREFFGAELKSTESPAAEGQTAPAYRELSSLSEESNKEKSDSSPGAMNTEEYVRIYENDFLNASDNPLSTFSIDVDTASYSNTRRHLLSGTRPPIDAVRIEELINYFDYGYPEVQGEHPFDFNTALSTCPWNRENLLLYVGIQGERKAYEELPPNNLVFLLDVSGSMSDQNKLPLLKKSLELLTKQLRSQDRVSIVVYAGAAGVVLEPTEGNKTGTIISAFDRLEAGGSTAGGEGIELAYRLAERTFMEHGNNRIIIATDGDFNVGPSSTSETTRLIEQKRDKGIFLTVLGFGMGNYKDSRMEQMADRGNGNYAYIDNILEAKKVLVQQISSTLFTIASDVKIQIEFNPYYVGQYRLIGYENRVMANRDFNDDTKDAGELGSGHTVTAIYEIVIAGETSSERDDMKYQDTNLSSNASESGEIMTIKFRYKNPGEETSILIEEPVSHSISDFSDIKSSFRFAASVAQWGMLLRGSRYMGTSGFDSVLDIAGNSRDYDPYGLKAEFINLVELSEYLD